MIHGITIRELESTSELQASVALQRATWGETFADLVPMPVLRIAQRTGGVVAGAFTADGRLVGFVFGITGIEEGVPVHWSDMLAVAEPLRNQGIGEALKRFQRDVLIERGVQRMYWTFDPLESRNAHINFTRLGVLSSEYVRDMYGESDSPLHRGLGTDRLVARWELRSSRVSDHLEGRATSPTARELDSLPSINPVTLDGLPRSAGPDLSIEAASVRLHIPTDIQTLKAKAPELAVAWRGVTRAAFEHYLARQLTVTAMVRGEKFGTYLLERLPFDT